MRLLYTSLNLDEPALPVLYVFKKITINTLSSITDISYPGEEYWDGTQWNCPPNTYDDFCYNTTLTNCGDEKQANLPKDCKRVTSRFKINPSNLSSYTFGRLVTCRYNKDDNLVISYKMGVNGTYELYIGNNPTYYAKFLTETVNNTLQLSVTIDNIKYYVTPTIENNSGKLLDLGKVPSVRTQKLILSTNPDYSRWFTVYYSGYSIFYHIFNADISKNLNIDPITREFIFDDEIGGSYQPMWYII